MRRMNRHNGDAVIDLTSLLDVIFIVLLIVICYASSINESYNESIAKNDSAKSELENAKNTYDIMNDELKNLTEFVGVIAIHVPYDEDDYTKRTVHILENGEDEIKKYEIVGNNKIENQSDLYDYLERYIINHEKKPVVISFNDSDEDILYRDELEIESIIDKLQEDYDNIIYVK